MEQSNPVLGFAQLYKITPQRTVDISALVSGTVVTSALHEEPILSVYDKVRALKTESERNFGFFLIGTLVGNPESVGEMMEDVEDIKAEDIEDTFKAVYEYVHEELSDFLNDKGIRA